MAPHCCNPLQSPPIAQKNGPRGIECGVGFPIPDVQSANEGATRLMAKWPLASWRWRVGELASWRVGELASWRVGELASWRVGVGELALASWRWRVGVGELALANWRWRIGLPATPLGPQCFGRTNRLRDGAITKQTAKPNAAAHPQLARLVSQEAACSSLPKPTTSKRCINESYPKEKKHRSFDDPTPQDRTSAAKHE